MFIRKSPSTSRVPDRDIPSAPLPFPRTDRRTADEAGLTIEGIVLGIPSSMAPEQASGGYS